MVVQQMAVGKIGVYGGQNHLSDRLGRYEDDSVRVSWVAMELSRRIELESFDC